MSSARTRTRRAWPRRKRGCARPASWSARATASPPRSRAGSPGDPMPAEPTPRGVISIGTDLFADALAAQGVAVTRVDWRPPAGGDAEVAALLARLWRDEVDLANRDALARLLAARPVLVDVRPALGVGPGMTRPTVLDAGPPIAWERMSGPLRGAVVGALLYERLADTPAAAERLVASGALSFDPCHHHAAVGPMAGVLTASMPVWVVEDRAHGHRAYATLNEGLGKVLRYGAQRDRLRHPRERTRRPLVHRARRDAGRPLLRGFWGGGRQPRHRRQRDHRDGRARRLRDGGGARHRRVRRRHPGRRARRHAAHVRDHPRRERRLPAAGARLPRHADRHRPPPGRADRRAAADQHRHRAPRAGDRPDRRRARQAAARVLRGGAPGLRRRLALHRGQVAERLLDLRRRVRVVLELAGEVRLVGGEVEVAMAREG